MALSPYYYGGNSPAYKPKPPPRQYGSQVGSSNSPYYYGAGPVGAPPKPPPQVPYTPGLPSQSVMSAVTGGQTQQQATPPPTLNVDYSNDPILARIKALGEEQTRSAEADALSQRTRLAIGFGDPELAKKLGLKQKVIQQAGENPFGTLQELQRGKTRRDVFDINRPLSDQANLFYSTERGRQLALSGESYLRDRSMAQNAVQDQLGQISNNLLQARMARQMQQIQAEQDAYNRALQQALYASGVS